MRAGDILEKIDGIWAVYDVFAEFFENNFVNL